MSPPVHPELVEGEPTSPPVHPELVEGGTQVAMRITDIRRMAFWVYIVRCTDGSFYVGQTDDLDRRIAEHTAGTFGGFTATRHFLEFAYAAEMPTRDEAVLRDRQIKGWSRAKKEALIASDWARLVELARKKGG